jgi:sigma-B regulation protein RsbU (phosphoserine phosphatase)
MKILFTSLKEIAEMLMEYLAPGGVSVNSSLARIVMDAAKLKPASIILPEEEITMEMLATLRQSSPSSFILLVGSPLSTDKLLKYFNSNLVHFYIESDNTTQLLPQIKSAFWNHYYLRRKIDQAESQTEYFLSRIEFLHEVTLKMLENKPLGKLLDEIMIASQYILDAEKSSFMLYEPNDKKLCFHVLEGYSENIIKNFPLELGSGIAGWVAKHRIPQMVDDCYSDKRFNRNYDKMSNFRTRNMVCVPLLKNDSLIGVLSVINKKGGKSFVVEDVRLLETLAGQCSVAIENSRLLETKVKAEALKKELETAHKIQEKLLPTNLPQFPTLSFAAKLIPAQEVGGDYYSIYKMTDELCLLLVADVSGKGIPAALLVSTIDATLHTVLKLKDNRTNPKFIAETINSVLCDASTIEKFATAWIGIIDVTDQKLYSINAGHNQPIILRSGVESVERLANGGIFLGVIPFNYEMEIVDFGRDDILVFFSDGVVEAMDYNNILFGDEKLVELITSNRSRSAIEILDLIIDEVLKHELSTNQSDDITLAIVKGI